MKTVSVLKWIATAGNGCAAVVTLNAAEDSFWSVGLNGTDGNGDRQAATHVVIDNLSNNAVMTFAYGPFLYRVSPYTRKTFPIVSQSEVCQFVISVGSVNIIFANFDPKIPDDTNQVSSTSSGSNTMYSNRQFGPGYGPNYAMRPADKNTIFINDTGSNFQYVTPTAALAGSDWFIPAILNRTVATTLRISPPSAADTIYYQGAPYSAGSEPVFPAGSSFMMFCDGNAFYLQRFM